MRTALTNEIAGLDNLAASVTSLVQNSNASFSLGTWDPFRSRFHSVTWQSSIECSWRSFRRRRHQARLRSSVTARLPHSIQQLHGGRIAIACGCDCPRSDPEPPGLHWLYSSPITSPTCKSAQSMNDGLGFVLAAGGVAIARSRVGRSLSGCPRPSIGGAVVSRSPFPAAE